MATINLTDFIRSTQDLPTLPAVAAQINQEVQNDDLTATTLATIINNDPSLTSKVLRLANSAYYGVSHKVDTLERAITVLGFNTIKNLALTVSVFKIFHKTDDALYHMIDLWHHCLGCAVASKAIAVNANPALAEQAFLCGIIHDIGKIAITQTMPDKMATVLQNIRDTNRTQSEAEQDILGFTHQEVGALLAEKWNFPEVYCKVIKLHHTPYSLEMSIDAEEATLISAVFVGNQIAKAMSFGESTDPKSVKIDVHTWQDLKVARDRITEFREQIRQDYENITTAWELE